MVVPSPAAPFGCSALRPMKVSSTSTTFPRRPWREPPARIASRMRCAMNQAVLRVTPKGPVELVALMPFLLDADQMDGLQPMAHRDMAGLENGPDLDRERLPAGIALVEADPVGLALERARLVSRRRNAGKRGLRPYPRLYVGVGGGLIVESAGRRKRTCHWLILLMASTLYPLGPVKYNIAILSSESRLINGLRAIKRGKFFLSVFVLAVRSARELEPRVRGPHGAQNWSMGRA